MDDSEHTDILTYYMYTLRVVRKHTPVPIKESVCVCVRACNAFEIPLFGMQSVNHYPQSDPFDWTLRSAYTVCFIAVQCRTLCMCVSYCEQTVSRHPISMCPGSKQNQSACDSIHAHLLKLVMLSCTWRESGMLLPQLKLIQATQGNFEIPTHHSVACPRMTHGT